MITAFAKHEEQDLLTQEDLLDIYASMLLVRTLDERAWAMNRQGKAAIIASARPRGEPARDRVGAPQERARLLLLHLLSRPRRHHHPRAHARAVAARFPRQGGRAALRRPAGPRSTAPPPTQFINPSNVIGSHVPQAVGWALAARMRGDNAVVACYFGDGTTSQGEVHEAMNFASVHKLPVSSLSRTTSTPSPFLSLARWR